MANWDLPNLNTTYDSFLSFLKQRDFDSVSWLDTQNGAPTAPQVGFKRWNSTNNYFERFDGGSWVKLSTCYTLDIGGGSTVEGTPIGLNSPAAAKFTSLVATSNSTFQGISTFQSGVYFNSATNFIGQATFNGKVVSNDALTASSIATTATATIGTTLTVNGNTSLSGMLSVAAYATFHSGVSFNSGISVSSASIGSVAVTGSATAPTLAKFNFTDSVATTRYVWENLGNRCGSIGLGGGVTSLLPSSAGSFIVHYYASPSVSTITLPPSNQCAPGANYLIHNTNANYNIVIGLQRSDDVLIGAGTTRPTEREAVIKPGQFIEVATDGAGTWCLLNGTFSPTASKYDVSFSNANTGWVQERGNFYRKGSTLQGGNYVATADETGAYTILTNSTNFTLPPSSQVKPGSTFTLRVASNGGTSNIYFQSPDTNSTYIMRAGDTVTFVAMDDNSWSPIEVSSWFKYAQTMFTRSPSVPNEGGTLALQNAAANPNPDSSIRLTNTQQGVLQIYDDTSKNGAYIDMRLCSYGASSKLWHSTNDGHGSGLDADLLDGFEGSAYMRCTDEIPAGSDLNDYVSNGLYVQRSNAWAAGGVNYPEGTAGLLTVAKVSEFVFQTYTTFDKSFTYKRCRYNFAWMPWVLTATTNSDQQISGRKTFTSTVSSTVNSRTAYGFEGKSSAQSYASFYHDGAPFFTSNFATKNSSEFWPIVKQNHIIDGISAWSASFGMLNQTDNSISAVIAMNGSAGQSQSWTFRTDGSFVCPGDIYAFSDARLKDNIVTIDNALEKVEALRGTYFNMRTEPDTRKVGLIAQEVMEVIPEAVSVNSDENETLSVAYPNLVGVLVEAIKELSEKVKNLERRLDWQ